MSANSANPLNSGNVTKNPQLRMFDRSVIRKPQHEVHQTGLHLVG
jgi:hypothetical protein